MQEYIKRPRTPATAYHSRELDSGHYLRVQQVVDAPPHHVVPGRRLEKEGFYGDEVV